MALAVGAPAPFFTAGFVLFAFAFVDTVVAFVGTADFVETVVTFVDTAGFVETVVTFVDTVVAFVSIPAASSIPPSASSPSHAWSARRSERGRS